MEAETKQRIKEVFIRDYADAGIRGMSVKRLCTEIPIARTTFYAYYNDLYSILEDIEDEIIDRLYKFNEKFRDYDLRRFKRGEPVDCFDETLAYIRDHKPCFRALMGSHAEASFIIKWKRIIRYHFKEKYTKEFPAFQYVDLVVEQIASSIIGAYHFWVFHNDEIPIEVFAQICCTPICFDFIGG